MSSKSELNEKSYFDLAVMLVKHQAEVSQIFDTNPDLTELMSELRFLRKIVDIYLSLNNPPTPREIELFDSLIKKVEDLGIKDIYEIEGAEYIVEEYLQYEYGYEDWEQYVERRQELLDHLDEMISYGASPDELRELCEENGHRLLFDEKTLKEKYAKYGFEYNPEDNSIIDISEEKLKNNPLAKKVFERIDILNKKSNEIYDENILGVPLEGKEDEAIDLNDEYGFLTQLLDKIREIDEIKEKGNTPLNQEREKIISRLVELLGDDLTEEQGKEFGELIKQLYDINCQIIRDGGTPLQQRNAELSALEAEASTITEAEALIDKKRAQQGEEK